MRAVQEIVTKEIKQPSIADNIDEIVAQGAAIMAANLSAPDLDSTPSSPRLRWKKLPLIR